MKIKQSEGDAAGPSEKSWNQIPGRQGSPLLLASRPWVLKAALLHSGLYLTQVKEVVKHQREFSYREQETCAPRGPC